MNASHFTRYASPLGCRLQDWSLPPRRHQALTQAAGVILDLDDTIYPHELYVHSGLLAVARYLEDARGIAAVDAFAVMSAARRGRQRGRELQTVCHHFGLGTGLVPVLLDVYRRHQPVLRLPKSSAVMLASLRRDGWRTVVLTNGDPKVQRAKVASLGLAPLVDAVVYAHECGSGKPAVEVFQEALRRIGVAAPRAVCVGDDPATDIAGARRLQIKSVWLRTGAQGARQADADATIDSLDLLPGVARELLGMVTVDAA